MSSQGLIAVQGFVSLVIGVLFLGRETALYIVSFYVFLSDSSEVGSCITDSGGWETLYMDDEDGGTIADQVTRFVSRFVDRVGTEAGISQEHLKSLYTMIPGE